MMKRIVLNQNTKIKLDTSNGKNTRVFTILGEKPIGDGASAICYHAKDESEIKGILKEFYPADTAVFRRDANGYLRKGTGYLVETPETYLKPYRLLQEKVSAFEFIPNFEVYTGADSVYVWTPQPPCIPFDGFLKKVYQSLQRKPVENLIQILLTIQQLAVCVEQLHCAGLLHRDIKPSNFGAYIRGEEFLSQTLCLFDINSICSVDDADQIIGTEGFMAPDSVFTCRSDVYSVGATLFYALTNRTFYAKNYPHIPRLLKSSEMFRCSSLQEDTEILKILTKVLQKSLCEDHDNRYPSCEAFLSDFEKVFAPLRITEILRGNGNHNRLLTKIRKQIDTDAEKNIRLVLQHHLYDNPILPDESKKISVCIFGFDTVGQLYLDMLLKVLHFPDVKVNFFVIDPECKKELYLEQRPALQDFYCVDRHKPSQDCYGNIHFYTAVNQLSEQPQLIFIAESSDSLTLRNSRIIHYQFPDSLLQCALETEKKSLPEWITPIYIKKTIQAKQQKLIEQMAWNVHLVWKKSLNITWRRIKEEFRHPYNFNSCIYFVLTMRHNLMYMNIDLRTMSAEDAAEAYLEKLSKKRDILICNEHGRWVTDKITDGYISKLSDIESMSNLKAKDETERQHVCIVPSSTEHLLKSWSHQKWDNSTPEELKKLDALEQMSVQLHRTYQILAKNIRKKENILGELMQSMRTCLPEHSKDSWNAFYHWFNTVKDIFHGRTEKTRLCQYMKQKFLSLIRTESKRKKIETIVRNFSNDILPIFRAAEYRDYKIDDEALIDQIPFILTYRDNITLAIPFQAKQIMKNFYAPMIVNPQKIEYLCMIDDRDAIREICDILPRIKLLKEKNVRSSIEFVFVDHDSMIKEINLKAIKDEGYNVRIFPDESSLLVWLQKQNRTNQLCAVENNLGYLSGYLKDKDIPKYRYKDGAIVTFSDKNALSYIKKEPVLLVDDVFRISNAVGSSSDQPEFHEDYEKLFEIYRKNPSTWKKLCNFLYQKQNTVYIAKGDEETASTTKFRVLLPSECGNGVKKVLEAAVDKNIISDYDCEWINTETFSVQMSCTYSQQSGFYRLFGETNALTHPERIEFKNNSYSPDSLIIQTGSLHENISLRYNDYKTPSIEQLDQYDQLLRDLRNSGYLLNYVYRKPNLDQQKNGFFSFTYATNSIRTLLTNAGRIFEVYIYHKVIESGKFDDVVNSYTCKWSDKVKNEFDFVLTKGMKTILIEAKARNEINNDIIYKLDSLQNHFSSDIKAILLVDINSDIPDYIRDRAKEDNITIINENKSIEDIGNVLNEL